MRRYGLTLLVGLLFLGQTIRITIPLVQYHSTAILPNDLGLAAMVILFVLQKLSKRNLFVRNGALTKTILAFIIVSLVSLLINFNYYYLSSHQFAVSLLYFGRWVLYCCAFFLVVELVRSPQAVRKLSASLSVGLLVFAAFGVLQAIFLPDFAIMIHPEEPWDRQGYRLVSTFFDPNLAACLLGVGLAFAVAFFAEGYRRAWYAVVLFGTALILTYSRGGLLSFAAGYLYLIIAGKTKRRAMVAIFLVGLILFLAAPYLLWHAEEYGKLTISDASSQGRVDSWWFCVELIRDNFVFGIGFDTLPYVMPRYYHYFASGYYTGEGATAFGLAGGGLLFIFALTGVFGCALYTYLFAKVCWMSHVVAKNSTDRFFRVLGKGTFASTIIVVVSSMFTSSMLYVFIMEFFWFLYGLLNFAYVSVQRAKASQAVAAARQPLRRPVPIRAPAPAVR